MLDLFLPFVIGIALGIEPEAAPTMVAEAPAAQELPEIDTGSGDDVTADRAPEPQIPTGKFTTATEVRPILGMTKSNWVAVRNFEGQDLIYFTHLLSWRCGLWDIRYGVNGAPANTVVNMEPCNEDLGQPNALTDPVNFPIFYAYPVESIESVYVEVVFDDGTTDFARFDRSDVLIP